MVNELGINENTGTLSFVFEVDGVTVKYEVSVRDGVQPGMIEETVRHFKVAVRTLMAGFTDTPEVPARTIWTDKPLHGEARVNIFSFGGFPVIGNDDETAHTMYDINIFNEFTTAQGAVNGAWDFLREVLASSFADDLVINGQRPQAKAQPADTSFKPTDPNDTPYLGGYNYKLNADYNANYGGHTASFDVMSMKRIYNRDGDPVIEVCSSYNGSVSKYPSHDLKIKYNRLEKVDDATRAILRPLFDAPKGDKTVILTPYVGTFYMFVPDDKPDKVYPVLVKLEAEGAPIPEEYEQPPTDGRDEIPF